MACSLRSLQICSMNSKLFFAGSPPEENLGEQTKSKPVFSRSEIAFNLFWKVGHTVEQTLVNVDNRFSQLSLAFRLQNVSQSFVSGRKRVSGKIYTVLKSNRIFRLIVAKREGIIIHGMFGPRSPQTSFVEYVQKIERHNTVP